MRCLPLTAALSAVLLMPLAASGSDHDEAGPADAAAQRVFIDPETGERRAPTPEELTRVPGLQKSTAPVMPAAERTADGVKVYRLGDAHHHALQARQLGPDGPLVIGHDTAAETSEAP